MGANNLLHPWACVSCPISGGGLLLLHSNRSWFGDLLWSIKSWSNALELRIPGLKGLAAYASSHLVLSCQAVKEARVLTGSCSEPHPGEQGSFLMVQPSLASSWIQREWEQVAHKDLDQSVWLSAILQNSVLGWFVTQKQGEQYIKESSDTGRLLLLELTVGSLSVIIVCSAAQSCPTLWSCAAHQAPLSLQFSRQEYRTGCYFLLQIFPTQGSNPHLLSLPHSRHVDSLPLFCHLGSLLQNLHAGNSHIVIWTYEMLQNKNIFINKKPQTYCRLYLPSFDVYFLCNCD